MLQRVEHEVDLAGSIRMRVDGGDTALVFKLVCTMELVCTMQRVGIAMKQKRSIGIGDSRDSLVDERRTATSSEIRFPSAADISSLYPPVAPSGTMLTEPY
jgi:hypothetical protein